MIYKEKIEISEKAQELLNNYLTRGDEQDYHLGENETLVWTARFPDGKEMDIKCCGTQYLYDGTSNNAWCEAVLFDENGRELCCTDVEDEFIGEWELADDQNTYITNIIVVKN